MIINRVAWVAWAMTLPFILLTWSTNASAQGNGAANSLGPKKTVAVGIFEAPQTLGGVGTGEGLSAMLTQALLKDGRVVVLERLAFGDIQGEQQLGQVGASTPDTAPKTGQLIGASVLIRGTVTKFSPQADGGSIGVGLPFSSGGSILGFNVQQAVVEIALRLIDTSTSQVIAATAASGTASARGFNVELYKSDGMHVGSTGFQGTPLGEAAEKAIKQAVEQIATALGKVPWSAVVIDNTDGTVFVSAGADRGVRAGTTLHVYRKVRDLTDPATSVVLDTLMDAVGTIQIQSVRDKTSLARVTSGSKPIRGDLLRLE